MGVESLSVQVSKSRLIKIRLQTENACMLIPSGLFFEIPQGLAIPTYGRAGTFIKI